MGIPDHLTCLLRNLSGHQEATEKLDMEKLTSSKFGKEYNRAYLFNFHAEYIMPNARLDEAQARIKISRRNINNLRYVDDTTLMAESEEELTSFLMRVTQESEKAGLKLSIQKMKIMASSPIS